MRAFPAEFEALLSPKGRQLLRGRGPAYAALQREPFFTAAGLLDARVVPACTRILTRAFADLLVEQTRPLPPANASTQSFGEVLPKVARMLTVPMTSRTDTTAFRRAEACGLSAMLFSQSYVAFCQALAGTPLEGPRAAQVLAYRPGDYAGPHTDHHPEHARTRGGYVDVHLTFCTAGVKEQLLVYERDGHLTEQRSLATSGMVTAYRLPVWHYTTPLQTLRASDRRWLVLGSFLLRS